MSMAAYRLVPVPSANQPQHGDDGVHGGANGGVGEEGEHGGEMQAFTLARTGLLRGGEQGAHRFLAL